MPAGGDMSGRPEIILVVAMARNRVIGRDNQLPWHIPNDLRHFRRVTLGKPVIMGRKTFDSIGKPLPERHNIVVTRNPVWQAEGVSIAGSLAEALEVAKSGVDVREIMVIGGAGVFAEALPLATRIELTMVELEPGGDVLMPPLDPVVWRGIAREDVAATGEIPAHSFITLARR